MSLALGRPQEPGNWATLQAHMQAVFVSPPPAYERCLIPSVTRPHQPERLLCVTLRRTLLRRGRAFSHPADAAPPAPTRPHPPILPLGEHRR